MLLRSSKYKKITNAKMQLRRISLLHRHFPRIISRSTSTIGPTPSLPSALEGIRVIDLTRVLAGPYATMVLGDLGAEIIKVEAPQGCDTRRWGPPFLTPKEGREGARESAYFLSVNRNKKSVCVNFKHDDGRSGYAYVNRYLAAENSFVLGKRIMYELAKKSDVLVENYVPGKLDELGLGYRQMSTLAPQLIYCSITGFGPDGPYSKRAGYDVIAASLGGLMHITGPKGGAPCKVGVALTDLCTGLYAHGAIMAALIARGRTGKGQKIDCDLLSTQVSTLANLGSSYLNSGLEAKRHGTEHASIVPYMTFEVADGYMTVGCGNDRQFEDFCGRIERPDLPVEYPTNEVRVKRRDELIPLLEVIMKAQTLRSWNEVFDGAGFPYGAVNNLKGVFEDPQVNHNRMKREMEHETLGTIKQVGPAVKFSGIENDLRSPPPPLGHHTDVVLNEVLEMTPGEIALLKKHGVVA